ncbi:baseplate J/gp47 family protein [Couchioplanes caeruleus]|uniref:baseplate J/gp47 family protein n=1 Tax=Couchioplanes caeruleus TaxID=56438 RepID=UPI0020BEF777|nr:baseplate J/gp47 family protein [Couchioplanes caeruleus]UQU67638.1 baseplate J/gp47 family protein [Couchioplanes caeruleus]
MSDFGVTRDGFVLKGFDAILGDAMDRARQMWAALGLDPDLTSTSPLRKLLEATAHEDAELWKRLEDYYYSAFVSTATGDALDLLGDDVGLGRRDTFATGTVTLTLTGGLPGRTYLVGEGTILLAPGQSQSYATAAVVALTAAAPVATVAVQAFRRGAAGNVPAGAITAVDPAYRAVYLADFGPADLTVVNQQDLTGGDGREDDDSYRGRQLGISRSLWTAEAVRQNALDVDGVIDVLLADPLGGVDVSQSFFGEFLFSERLFNAERRIGEPYRFDVVVAHDFRWPWTTTGAVPGVFERVSAAIDLVRPAGVHPNVVEADHIDVGVRARIVTEPGQDQAALSTAIREALAAGLGDLRLGGDVLYSRVVRTIVEVAGVVDVQRLHLRRHPPAFGRITLGDVPYLSTAVDAAVGQNLTMGPTELPVLRTDAELHDLELVTP